MTPAAPPPVADAARTPLLSHIAALWPVLTRQPVAMSSGGSALTLPSAYVVPAAAFAKSIIGTAILRCSASREIGAATFRRRLAALRGEHAWWMRDEDGLALG